jgi:hypothetical protein
MPAGTIGQIATTAVNKNLLPLKKGHTNAAGAKHSKQ